MSKNEIKLGLLSDEDKVITFKNKKYDILLKTITGSRLYGTQYEKGEHPFDPDYVSDYDFRGFFIPPTQDRLSLITNVPEQIKIDDGEDTEIFDILKFVQLSIDNNPNIMDVLFTNKESILYSSDVAQLILDNKHLFISLKAKDSFNGYALQQLHRMKQHYRWAKTYPEIYKVEAFLQDAFNDGKIDFQWIADYFAGSIAEKVTGETSQKHKHLNETISIEDFISIYSIDFDLFKFIKPHIFDFMNIKTTTFKSVDKKSQDFKAIFDKSIYSKINDNTFVIYNNAGNGIFSRDGGLKNSEKKIDKSLDADFVVNVNFSNYKSALKEIKSIWEWKVNRNEKRAALEERFGYDVKHGMHLYRLLISAKKLLLTGTYQPKLEAEDLKLAKDILSGKISYFELIDMAENLSKELNVIAKENKIGLQETADVFKINELLMKIYSLY